MSDKSFIDTNILVYAHDVSDKAKNDIAINLILEGIRNDSIVISTQVINEFFVTVTKKIQKKMLVKNARKEIILLKCVEIVEIDTDIIINAIDIMEKNKLSYWDSLIICSAKKAGCSILYTEDMNAGQTIETVKIINLFS